MACGVNCTDCGGACHAVPWNTALLTAVLPPYARRARAPGTPVAPVEGEPFPAPRPLATTSEPVETPEDAVPTRQDPEGKPPERPPIAGGKSKPPELNHCPCACVCYPISTGGGTVRLVHDPRRPSPPPPPGEVLAESPQSDADETSGEDGPETSVDQPGGHGPDDGTTTVDPEEPNAGGGPAPGGGPTGFAPAPPPATLPFSLPGAASLGLPELLHGRGRRRFGEDARAQALPGVVAFEPPEPGEPTGQVALLHAPPPPPPRAPGPAPATEPPLAYPPPRLLGGASAAAAAAPPQPFAVASPGTLRVHVDGAAERDPGLVLAPPHAGDFQLGGENAGPSAGLLADGQAHLGDGVELHDALTAGRPATAPAVTALAASLSASGVRYVGATGASPRAEWPGARSSPGAAAGVDGPFAGAAAGVEAPTGEPAPSNRGLPSRLPLQRLPFSRLPAAVTAAAPGSRLALGGGKSGGYQGITGSVRGIAASVDAIERVRSRHGEIEKAYAEASRARSAADAGVAAATDGFGNGDALARAANLAKHVGDGVYVKTGKNEVFVSRARLIELYAKSFDVDVEEFREAVDAFGEADAASRTEEATRKWLAHSEEATGRDLARLSSGLAAQVNALASEEGLSPREVHDLVTSGAEPSLAGLSPKEKARKRRRVRRIKKRLRKAKRALDKGERSRDAADRSRRLATTYRGQAREANRLALSLRAFGYGDDAKAVRAAGRGGRAAARRLRIATRSLGPEPKKRSGARNSSFRKRYERWEKRKEKIAQIEAVIAAQDARIAARSKLVEAESRYNANPGTATLHYWNKAALTSDLADLKLTLAQYNEEGVDPNSDEYKAILGEIKDAEERLDDEEDAFAKDVAVGRAKVEDTIFGDCPKGAPPPTACKDKGEGGQICFWEPDKSNIHCTGVEGDPHGEVTKPKKSDEDKRKEKNSGAKGKGNSLVAGEEKGPVAQPDDSGPAGDPGPRQDDKGPEKGPNTGGLAGGAESGREPGDSDTPVRPTSDGTVDEPPPLPPPPRTPPVKVPGSPVPGNGHGGRHSYAPERAPVVGPVGGSTRPNAGQGAATGPQDGGDENRDARGPATSKFTDPDAGKSAAVREPAPDAGKEAIDEAVEAAKVLVEKLAFLDRVKELVEDYWAEVRSERGAVIARRLREKIGEQVFQRFWEVATHEAVLDELGSQLKEAEAKYRRSGSSHDRGLVSLLEIRKADSKAGLLYSRVLARLAGGIATDVEVTTAVDTGLRADLIRAERTLGVDVDWEAARRGDGGAAAVWDASDDGDVDFQTHAQWMNVFAHSDAIRDHLGRIYRRSSRKWFLNRTKLEGRARKQGSELQYQSVRSKVLGFVMAHEAGEIAAMVAVGAAIGVAAGAAGAAFATAKGLGALGTAIAVGGFEAGGAVLTELAFARITGEAVTAEALGKSALYGFIGGGIGGFLSKASSVKGAVGRARAAVQRAGSAAVAAVRAPFATAARFAAATKALVVEGVKGVARTVKDIGRRGVAVGRAQWARLNAGLERLGRAAAQLGDDIGVVARREVARVRQVAAAVRREVAARTRSTSHGEAGHLYIPFGGGPRWSKFRRRPRLYRGTKHAAESRAAQETSRSLSDAARVQGGAGAAEPGTVVASEFPGKVPARPPAINLAGEGEIPGVLNQNIKEILDPRWRRSADGLTLREVRNLPHRPQFVISANDRLPFRSNYFQTVYTNSAPINKSTIFGPGVVPSEVVRILRPGGQWIVDGSLHFTK